MPDAPQAKPDTHAAPTPAKPILNVHDIPLIERPEKQRPQGAAAKRYGARMGLLGQAMGAKRLGYNLTVIDPGKRAFPFHNHHANEEMFFVVSGTGQLRFGKATYDVKPGDVIACPPGGPEVAHQLINTGSEDLKVLSVSTQVSPDAVDYPDTGRFGILGDWPGKNPAMPNFAFIGREEDSLPYWDGE